MKTNKEMFDELEEFIASKNYDSAELIAILHRAQAIFGYLPMNVQTFIADKLKINVSKVYGVVTFYSFFTMVPKGENIARRPSSSMDDGIWYTNTFAPTGPMIEFSTNTYLLHENQTHPKQFLFQSLW